jgi:SM-20-related protein
MREAFFMFSSDCHSCYCAPVSQPKLPPVNPEQPQVFLPRRKFLHHTQIATIINDLARAEYSLIDDLFSNRSIESLHDFFISELQKNLFRSAMVAGNQKKVVEEKIRSDLIHWLSDVDFEAIRLQSYAEFFSEFTTALNHELFLGINHHDLHFSLYPLGAFYGTHLDQSRRNADRKITFIHYLNRDWKPCDGGELRLYLDDEKSRHVDIEPVWGRCLFFVSDRFYHEVLPSTAESRQSLSGWFSASSSITYKS